MVTNKRERRPELQACERTRSLRPAAGFLWDFSKCYHESHLSVSIIRKGGASA